VTNVPVVVGKVSVVLPETDGACSMTEPLVSPDMVTLDIVYPYIITHLEVEGTVIATPEFIVSGPTDMALDPVVMV
jgi:hypothetical protein